MTERRPCPKGRCEHIEVFHELDGRCLIEDCPCGKDDNAQNP